MKRSLILAFILLISNDLSAQISDGCLTHLSLAEVKVLREGAIFTSLRAQLPFEGRARLERLLEMAERRSFSTDPLVTMLANEIVRAFNITQSGYFAQSFKIESPNIYVAGRIEQSGDKVKILFGKVITNDLKYNGNPQGVNFTLAKVIYGVLLASDTVWKNTENVNQLTLVAEDISNDRLKHLLSNLGMLGQFSLAVRLVRN